MKNLQLPHATLVGIVAPKPAPRHCEECGEPTRLLRLVRTAPTCTGQRCLKCGWESAPQYTLDANGQAVAMVIEVAMTGGMV